MPDQPTQSEQPAPVVTPTPTTSDDERSEALWTLVAKLGTAIPFALATLAILYDVGWFARIGLDFSSLFSLTEHLVFGMEGIPYLLGALIVIYLIMGGSIVAAHRLRAEAHNKAAAYVRGGTVSFFLVGGVFYIFRYPDAWPTGVAFIVVGVMYLFSNLTEPPGRIAILLVGGFVTILLFGFAQGYAIAAAILNQKVALSWPRTPSSSISLVGGPPISGRVLRSGERGMLVFDDLDSSIQFKRWDEVRGIEVTGRR